MCVCVYIDKCMYINIYKYIFVCTHIYIYTYMYRCVYIYVYINIYQSHLQQVICSSTILHMYTHIHTCMYINTCTYMYIYIYIQVDVSIHYLLPVPNPTIFPLQNSPKQYCPHFYLTSSALDPNRHYQNHPPPFGLPPSVASLT